MLSSVGLFSAAQNYEMALSTKCKVDWLYPELLSNEGLIEILSQHFVKLPEDTSNSSRDDLLDLYYQFVIPCPQRKYRQNRRGRDMMKRQILQNKKRKTITFDTSEPPAKKTTTEPSRLLTSFGGRSAGDRLKPPPSCINFEKKVIKLGASKASDEPQSTSATSSASSNDVSHSPVSTAPRVIKLNRSPSGDAKSPTSVAPQMTMNKTIKLINSHLSGSGDSAVKSHESDRSEQHMETDSPEPSTEKKVKITKISWP